MANKVKTKEEAKAKAYKIFWGMLSIFLFYVFFIARTPESRVGYLTLGLFTSPLLAFVEYKLDIKRIEKENKSLK